LYDVGKNPHPNHNRLAARNPAGFVGPETREFSGPGGGTAPNTEIASSRIQAQSEDKNAKNKAEPFDSAVLV
jgi:hypothetical protein